jgi:hypothetical protein
MCLLFRDKWKSAGEHRARRSAADKKTARPTRFACGLIIDPSLSAWR